MITMRSILNLFGRSPFVSLQSHMDSVARCVSCLPAVFEALEQKDYEKLEKLAQEISRLEHNADLIKNDIRNHLPKSLFLPIDRGYLLEMLSIQDRIADSVEDIAVLLTLKPLELLPIFKEEFKLLVHKNIETFQEVHLIIKELPELVESSFGGMEAQTVRKMVEKVGTYEHEADLIQRKLLKKIFEAEDQLNYITFHQWQRLFDGVTSISNLAENLANRVRMTLELE
jgi:uncharacterized protein